jgi:hypothetical protein
MSPATNAKALAGVTVKEGVEVDKMGRIMRFLG